MAYSPKQWRAIRLYSERNKVTPQLSAFPFVRFLRADGEIESMHISTLEDFYVGHKEKERRANAERRKLEKKHTDARGKR